MIQGERLVFFDLETAGLDTNSAIIQIAAIAVDAKLRELETFETKIRFDVLRADSNALAVNSFEPTVWKRLAKRPHDAAKDFASFLRRHATVDMTSRAGKPYQLARLVAHNATFDGPIIIRWYKDLGEFLPAARSVYCTLQRAYWLFEENKSLTPPANYKLSTLCEYVGVALGKHNAHDALVDVRATVELYRSFQDRKHADKLAA